MASSTPEPYFLKRSIWNTNTGIRTWMHISHFVSGLWASCWVFVLNNERGLANRTVYHVIKIVFYLARIVTHGHVNMKYLSNFTGNSFSRNKILNYKPSIYFLLNSHVQHYVDKNQDCDKLSLYKQRKYSSYIQSSLQSLPQNDPDPRKLCFSWLPFTEMNWINDVLSLYNHFRVV